MREVGGVTQKNPALLKISPELQEVQDLMPMDGDDYERLKEDIRENGVRHPVICYHEKGALYVLAGAHRLKAALQLGLSLVPVQTVEGERDEFSDFAIRENLARRHLTREQKQRLVDHFLKKGAGDSDRVIAKQAGAHHKTVAARRAALESTGEIRQLETRKGEDGKTRKPPAKAHQTHGEPRRAPKKSGQGKGAGGTLEDRLRAIIDTLEFEAEMLHDKSVKESNDQKAMHYLGAAWATAQIIKRLKRIIK